VTTAQGGTTETRTLAIDRKHQLSVAAYDGRGNMTVWGNERYRWDEMNMLFQRDFPQDTYIYTADDERIGKIWWDGTTIRENYTLRNLGNQALRMYDRALQPGGTAQWTWLLDYIHDATGRPLLSVNNKPFPNRNQHYATDHLGSPLVTTDQQGNILATDSFWAFGEDAGTTGPVARRRFTGHERDANLRGRIFDLDYMHAREYSPHLGRFLSVDPARRSVNPMAPQSWNRYTYGLNNPMTFVDPDGKAAIVAIVEQSNMDDNKKGLVGHAALFVTSEQGSAGVSLFGGHNFEEGLNAFLLGYSNEGRSTRLFLLETTPEQDALMVEFLKNSPGANVDTQGFIGSNNCTTAVCNTLKAGGVLEQSSGVGSLGGIDSPKFLLNAILSGDIKVRTEIFVRVLAAVKEENRRMKEEGPDPE
jgi:RHS repeat-associated protein